MTTFSRDMGTGIKTQVEELEVNEHDIKLKNSFNG